MIEKMLDLLAELEGTANVLRSLSIAVNCEEKNPSPDTLQSALFGQACHVGRVISDLYDIESALEKTQEDFKNADTRKIH